MDTIIEAIRQYILTCPFLANGLVNVDFLGSKPTEYSIDILPCNPIIKKYIDGGSLRQYMFAFTSKEYYSSGEMQNIENSGFYEKFASWIEKNNLKNILPILGEKKYSQEIEIQSSGYLFDNDGTNARYQIQLRLIYSQEV